MLTKQTQGYLFLCLMNIVFHLLTYLVEVGTVGLFY